MLVFGDPEFRRRLPFLVEKAKRHVADASPDSLESLRDLVIELGELEQAVEDWVGGNPGYELLASHVRAATDHVATTFHARWRCRGIDGLELKRAAKELAELDGIPDVEVRVKLPEGFAFYRLFPDQYCESAVRWSGENAGTAGRIAVIGVRSIGTTLSAVVSAALRCVGRDCYRITVRPTGDPYRRKTQLDRLEVGTEFALVVDEGPGASGSSMGGIAEALAGLGFSEERIFFFPAHRNGPGQAASDETRRWWNTIPKYTSEWKYLQWDGRDAVKFLANEAAQMAGARSRIVAVDDLSAGLWRRHVFDDEEEWPVVCPIFERSKLRVRFSDGSSVVAKFVGVGPDMDGDGSLAESGFRDCVAKASRGWAPMPAGIVQGFIIRRWVEGQALSGQDVDREVVKRIGDYLSSSMGAILTAEEWGCSIRRLNDVVLINGRSAFPEISVSAVERLMKASSSVSGAGASTDGRMAPHEWIRSGDRQIVKIDGLNHQSDHTIVGKQPIYWDLAGTVVEWNLDGGMIRLLCEPVERAGVRVDEEVLRFFELAYASFRFGQVHFALGAALEAVERRRLERAAQRYGGCVRRAVRGGRMTNDE